MSGDEIVVLLVGSALTLLLWGQWYWRAARVARLLPVGPMRGMLLICPLVCMAVLLGVLRTLAAGDVRDSEIYLTMYTVFGAVWLAVAVRLAAIFGINAHEDAIERRNRAAGYAVCGALLAITLCFAGANVGDGPGWWVVAFSAALSTGALFAVWAVMEAAGTVSESITVERNAAAGIRLAGFLIAAGLIFGRAAAGDWLSAQSTVSDFLLGAWPALLLLIVAVPVELLTRPTMHHPAPETIAAGALPAVCYVGGSIVAVMAAGIPT